MEIHRVQPDGAEAISVLNRTVQALHAAAHPHLFKPPSPETFSAAEVAALIDAPGHIFYIAVVDGVPAGYVYVQVVHRAESAIRHALDMVYINHLSVDETYQRMGVGSALVEAVRELAREQGITHIELDVWAFNDHARRFFERQGFTVYNQRLWMDIGDL